MSVVRFSEPANSILIVEKDKDEHDFVLYFMFTEDGMQIFAEKGLACIKIKLDSATEKAFLREFINQEIRRGLI